jgi:hypothetical protein
MRECNNKHLIDDYLLNKLSKAKREEFEEHYFNCSECFKRVSERDDLIAVIKEKGSQLLQDVAEDRKPRPAAWIDKVTDFLTPKQWVAATVSVAAVLIVVLTLMPVIKSPAPQFFINDDMVRGESITLISPVIDVDSVPTEFSWESSGEDIEYRIYIYNEELLWSATTQETSISLPEEVRERMVAGETYSWQVKAFSPEGGLAAVSSRVQFRFSLSQ